MANEKAWYILWFCRTSGTVSPSLCEIHTYNLNHVSVFPVTPRLSCLPLASPTLTYPSRHHLIHGCWLINIRDSVFFCCAFYCRTNHFILVCSKCFHQSCFYSSPPWVLSPTCHFPLPFSPSWLPSGSLLLCLFALFVASVAPVRFWVSWTDRCCGRSAALLTHGQHHTWTRAIKHVCGSFPPEMPVSPGNVCALARGYY
jgi:hypothetical protein